MTKKIRLAKRKSKISRNKYKKYLTRQYQRRFFGKLPDFSCIPSGFYCYTKTFTCPYHSYLNAKKHNNWIGLVSKGQQYIGYCSLIDKSDNDLNGFGLLWDECKECGWYEND